MYLLDTNVLLELLLDQVEADTVERLLGRVPLEKIYVTDFTIHSLGLAFVHRKMYDALLHTVDDLLASGGVGLIRLEMDDMKKVVSAAQRHNLDFDDAYQYTAATKHDLILVSLDHDFDRTERGRKTPQQVLAE